LPLRLLLPPILAWTHKLKKVSMKRFQRPEKVTWYESEGNYEVLFTNTRCSAGFGTTHEGNVIKRTLLHRKRLMSFMLAR
jgi:hypothetical protein